MASPEQAIGDKNLNRLQTGLERFFGETRGRFRVVLGTQKIPTENLAATLEAIQGVAAKLKELSGLTLVAEVRRQLMELVLTDEVRDKITELCPDLQIRESDIKDHHCQKGQEATVKAKSRMKGRNYLRALLERYESSVRNALQKDTPNRLISLEDKMVIKLGEDYRGVATLIFHLTRGKIKIVERIVEAQLNGKGVSTQTRPGEEDEEPFFDHLLEFLGIYADVTQELIEKSRKREEIQKRSDRVLTSILSDPDLQSLTEGGEKQAINLFFKLFLFFDNTPGNRSPWFCGDLMHTPFDAGKLHSVIQRGVPREALARVLLELNDFAYFDDIREMRRVIKEHEKQPAESDDTTGPKDEHKKKKQRKELKGIGNKIDAIIVRRKLVDDLKSLKTMPLAEKAELVRNAIPNEEDPMETVTLNAGQPVSPQEVILRVIHPKTIFKDPAAQMKFLELLEDLKAMRGTNATVLKHSLADVVNNDDEFLDLPLEYCGRRSIRELLTEFILDRFERTEIRAKAERPQDELPLLPLVDKARWDIDEKRLKKQFNTAGVGIPRDMLLRAAKAMGEVCDFGTQLRFAEEAAELYLETRVNEGKGVKSQYKMYYYPFATFAFQDLIHHCLPDRSSGDHVIISNQEYDSLTELFPVKRGIKEDREDLREAFSRELPLIQGQTLEQARPIIERIAELFFETHLHLGKDHLELKKPPAEPAELEQAREENLLDHGIPEFLAAKLAGSVPPQAIHDLIKNKAPQHPTNNVRVVYLNDRQKTHDSKTVDELFHEISGQIDPLKTRMILLSTKTRFGDAACSMQEAKSKPNSHHLAELIAKLKAAHPGIPIVVDACQALGRGRPDRLRDLNADVYLTSGKKALGAGNVALMAFSEEFRKTPIGNRFRQRDSSMPIEDIVAMGLGMHLLRHHIDFMRLEGNFGESRKKSLAQKIASHMAGLTDHAIQRALQYGDQFVKRHITPERRTALERCTSVPPNQLFGCQVVYPVHRNFQDYSGVLTLVFPNINGRKLKNKLKEKGYDVVDCLKGAKAVRISFHYLHDPADIDVLFEAIQEIQLEELEEQLKPPTPKAGQPAPERRPIEYDIAWIPN